MSKLHVPVIIVGAGPTGLTAGNLLGQAGIEALILEQSATLCAFPRAIAIDDEGLRICQSLGLGEPILAHTLLNLTVYYRSNGRLLSRVAPTGRRNGYPFVSTFYQPEFEDILFNGLQRFPNVQVRFQHTVESLHQDNDCVTVTVRAADGSRQEITCSYLLACDGGKSIIRRLLNIPMRGTTFAQRWLVIDAVNDENDGASQSTDTSDDAPFAIFFCDPQRPAMTILSPGQRRRWEFMLLPGEADADMLNDEVIQTLIRQTGYTTEPHITRKTIYTFHASRAAAFSQGRVFLLGDAAHLMPPFGGQGMNSGLRDTHNLCWKLAMALHGEANPSLLKTYQIERAPHVAAMIRFSTLLGNIIMPTRKPAAMLRDAIFYTLNAIPRTRAMFSEGGIKPAPRYPHGALVTGNTRASSNLTGILLPQPEVTCNGQRVLLDDILGPGFALLRCSQDPMRAFTHINTDFWQRLGTRLVCVQPAGTPSTTSTTTKNLYTVHTDDAQFFHLCKDLFILVRPDRFIMGAFKEEDADRFVAKCQKLFNG